MPQLVEFTRRSSDGSKSPLSFLRKEAGSLTDWDRFLTIDGLDAFHIGNSCDTCAFFFERMQGTNYGLGIEDLSAQLSHGLTNLDADLVDTLAQLMPKSDYIVGLFRLKPQLVRLRSNEDYFATDMVDYEDEIWEIGPPDPHHPRTSYYRVDGRYNNVVQFKQENVRAFDFIIPIEPLESLNQTRIEFYEQAIADGIEPTVVSLSVLDVKGKRPGELHHQCLAHYLIDGHHKLAAAARRGKFLTLIAFITVDHSFALQEQFQCMLNEYSS